MTTRNRETRPGDDDGTRDEFDSDDVNGDDVNGDDDLEPVFVVERRASRVLTPVELDRRRATKRHALLGLAVVIVVVAVTITLVALLVSTPTVDATPSAAAQSWGRAIVHGERSVARSLQCRAHLDIADELRRVLVDPADARAGRATRAGRARWMVPIIFSGATGRVQVRERVDVIRRDGRFLVC